jgi:molybdopterin-containing oxidoreductase family membrane subunit
MRAAPIPREPIRTLVAITRVAILINLLMVVSVLFTEFYTGTAHSKHAYYLYFGLHGRHALTANAH